ncbi:hypothetical protein SAMN04487983_101527 [Streptomyces sp. yr375]|uniref:hypothetical protein n=1 Tax=Streptomyces sp. yr375 TaxID=1761906 RepID=UPI0008D41EE7|nr:hypothetical protein [Streptomyces sp. yr375]SER35710.1 hypothetical protein SAMN04487983_101527 [Streptomyces sp. yr375]
MKRALAARCTIAALTAVTAMAGCGRDTAPPSRPQALTWQQELRLTDAEQRLTSQCMKRHGFTYAEDRGLTLRESMPVRFVQDDVAWARTYGYGGRIDAEQEQVRLHNPVAAYRQTLSAARRTAFDQALDGGSGNGSGSAVQVVSAELPGSGREVRKRLGGCTAEAEKALYGDPGDWFRASKTATGLNALYAADLMRDRQLTTAVAAWSRCMKKSGLTYPDPQAARDATRENTARLGTAAADKAFATERRIAVADATCARATSLKSVATARETHYVDRLPTRYGKALDTYRRLQHQAYDRAVRIVPQRA